MFLVVGPLRLIRETTIVDNVEKPTTTAVETNSADWTGESCFAPRKTPVLGTHDMSRILNLGFPKCGTSSIHQVFVKAGFKSRHYHCGKAGYCGACMKQRRQVNETLLAGCGNFTVFTQLDRLAHGHGCIFPQIQYLQELYDESPHATWILPFRNVTDWIRSVTHWTANGRISPMIGRFKRLCRFPQLNITNIKTDDDFFHLWCQHVKHVRSFVETHPTLSLVEFSIEDPDAGQVFADVFGVNASFWGQANKS